MKKAEKISTGITIAIILGVYILSLIVFINSGAYQINPGTNNDRFFSMDDSYYVNHIYSIELDNTDRIVKHPLLIAFAHYATSIEHVFFGDLSVPSHYLIIVLGQLLVSFLGLLFLFKLLMENLKLPIIKVNLLVIIYALSSAVLLYTFIAESYILSGTILIASLWCALNNKPKSLIILGILAGGITITNFAIWVIIAFFINKSFINRIKLMLISGAGLAGVILLLPIRGVFFPHFFKVFIGSPENFSDHYALLSAAKRGFYSIFGSAYFYLDTVNQSPFGQLQGKAISFVPSANILIIAAMCIWIAGIAAASVKGIKLKDKLLLAPLAILIFNILLHVGIQYGLKEAFLYSLHHSFAQILIIGYLIKNTTSPMGKKVVFGLTCVYLLIMIGVNISGGVQLVDYIKSLNM